MKPVKLTAYDSRDRVTTDYSKAVGWGYSDKTLPRHGGGCSASKWLHRTLGDLLGNNAPSWLAKAEYERREALRKERGE
jgi:hypothetical protein